MILAGGLGTRLREVYAGPKCLAPVAGRPFLDYVLRWLASQSVRNVVVCVGYKGSSVERYVGAGLKWGLRVAYSREEGLLGTGGALKKAEKLISGYRMLVINGDTLARVDLKKLVDFHESRRAVATLALTRVRDAGRYGLVKVDRQERIRAFMEKKQGRRASGRDRLVNAGVYVLEKRALDRIRTQRPSSLERDVFPRLTEGGKICGFVSNGHFIDIGIPEDFRRAQSELREW